MLFDDTERRKWQNPEGVLDAAGLGSGMTFIDIGAGGVSLPFQQRKSLAVKVEFLQSILIQ